MKRILIFIIECYQIMPLTCHKMCRFTPTCSEYMKIAIERFGVIKGIRLGLIRLKNCHPFGPYGYDAVPNKEEL